MIAFVVPEEGRFGIDAFLSGEGAAIAQRFRIVTYEALAHYSALPLGTWIFAALDRLGLAERELARLAANRIVESGAPARVLNSPADVKLRTDLLRTAHVEGLNTFDAVRADKLRPDIVGVLRFPVFVREADAHNGSLTPLLADCAALDRALFRLRLQGFSLAALLVVEFCDTSDARGMFRKYSAFIVGDRILPRYMNASREWMVKQGTRLYEPELAEEEAAYLDGDQHADWLRRAFCLAGIDYGRLDYGVRAGDPQLWEVNTNPTIGRTGKPRVRPPEAEVYRARIAPGRARFYERFLDAWTAIDTDLTGEVPFGPHRSLTHACAADAARRRQGRKVTLVARLRDTAWGRILGRVAQPVVERVGVRAMRRG